MNLGHIGSQSARKYVRDWHVLGYDVTISVNHTTKVSGWLGLGLGFTKCKKICTRLACSWL